MKSYQLHSAENRRAVFASLSPRIWLEKDLLRIWVVADPSLILQIFHSPMVTVSSLADVLENIRENYGVELPNVVYACGVLPLRTENAAHPMTRKGFATFLSARLNELEQQLPALSKACMTPLTRTGRVDIVSEVVDLFMERVFSVLLGCRLPPEFLSMRVGDILSFNANLSLLKGLDDRIAKTLSFLRRTSVSEDEVAWKFTCLVFGLDSLAMMLTESIATILRKEEASAGAKLPDFPLETGVPVTFRRAKDDFDIERCAVKAGDLLRLQLQSFGYSDIAEDRKFIFGAGVHSCVGKQLSLRIWRHFKREFDSLDLKARIARYELIPSHVIIRHKLVEVEVLR